MFVGKMKLIFLVAVLVFCTIVSYAQKPIVSETVTFVNSEIPFTLSVHDRGTIPMNSSSVAVVHFVFSNNIDILMSRELNDIFVKIDTDRNNYNFRYAKKTFLKEHGDVQVQIYGSNEEVLKEQVFAMLDFISKQEQGKRNELKDITERESYLAQRLEILPEEIKRAKEQTSLFSNETGCYSTDQAQVETSQYKKMLNIINVEIVGVNAKLNAIEEYEAKEVSQQIKEKLFLMKLESEIDLESLIAKKDTVSRTFVLTQNFSKYHAVLSKLEEEQKEFLSESKLLTKKHFDIQRKIESFESIKLRTNEVNIKPLKFIQ